MQEKVTWFLLGLGVVIQNDVGLKDYEGLEVEQCSSSLPRNCYGDYDGYGCDGYGYCYGYGVCGYGGFFGNCLP